MVVLYADTDVDRRQQVTRLLEFMETEVVDASERQVCRDLVEGSPDDIDLLVVGQVGGADALQDLVAVLDAQGRQLPVARLRGARISSFSPPPQLPVCCDLSMPITLRAWQEAMHKARTWRARAADGPPLELFRLLVGVSPGIGRVRDLVQRVAAAEATVLILGESGTGKEVVARAIHDHSPRRGAAFVPLNCGAIPGELLESEMFGHEKGAFTGALSSRTGRFELAQGGTLFLDEIGDMPAPMQVKLLRVLQERVFQRVGSNDNVDADVRVIAATHQDLEAQIRDGQFREDLFYRLNVFPIEICPLRERPMDIPLLMAEMIHRAERGQRGAFRLTPTAVEALCVYPWPGNVRELSNLFERLLVLFPYQVVDEPDLPERYRSAERRPGPDAAADDQPAVGPGAAGGPAGAPGIEMPGAGLRPPLAVMDGVVDLRQYVADMERGLIHWALEASDGVVAAAARRLKINRTTLVEKMRKYEMQHPKESLES